MPFDPRGLMLLLATSPFAIWHYRTTDSRAAVLKPGYFNPATGQLQAGHLVILQAGDAMTLLPVRGAGAVGDGLILDTVLAPLHATCSATIRFGVLGTATVTHRAVVIDPMPNPYRVENTLRVGATVTGPSSELRFALLNSAGAIVSGPVTVAVSAGRADAELPGPPDGSGYRLRVTDAEEALVSRTSSPFSIIRSSTGPVPGTAAFSLLTETGSALRLESGGRLTF